MGANRPPQMVPPPQNQQGMGMRPPMQIPGAPTPGLHGYKPSMLPSNVSKQTPETMPVGVLSTMLAQFIRKNTSDEKNEFIPYRPLDPSVTPQQLPPMEPPTQRLLERVEDFY